MTRLNRLENQARRKQLVEDGDRRGDPTLAPKFAAEILTRAAAVYGAHERKDLAERHLRRAAELCPGDTACRAALAELYGADGRIAEALAVVEELRQIEPQNVSHLKNVGILQGRLGRWEAAQKTFKDLCAIAPDIAVGYAGLAEAYLRAGQELPLARLLAAKAAALEPSAWNFFILGTICERLGDPDAAKSALKKAMALDPGNPRYQQLYSSMKGKD
jgi:tetratricopeptide (TPR) repeat protein